MNNANIYIGGEIEINPFDLDIQEIGSNNLQKYSFYLDGRMALKIILKKIQPKKMVLLPSYLCPSILQPLKEIGLKYDYYRINEDFSIDESSILNKIGKKKYDVVLVINYFGLIGKNDLTIKIIKDFDRQIKVIEDWSHLSFIPYELNYYRSTADFIFGSLRKIFAVPDGGFILANKSYSFKNNKNIDDYLVASKILGKCLRYLYVNGYFKENKSIERIYLKMLENGEKYLDEKIQLTKISLILMSKFNFKGIYELRRNNYFNLSRLLKSNKLLLHYIDIIKENMEQNEMPYMLPVYIKNIDRNLLRYKLRDKGIFCSIIWEIPKEITFKNNRNMSNNILCLPIDQRYNEIHMGIIYNKIKDTLLK